MISGNLRAVRPMSVPIATMLCRMAKVRSIVNQTVQWNEANAKISPGLLIETLVVYVLCNRKPLWKVEQFWAEQDLSHLFAEGINATQLNDDAYGHALDKLAEVDVELIISLVTLTMLHAHNLGISFVHLDTTSKSPELVSKISEKIMPQLTEWQNRPLESVYPFIFMDAIHYKIRENHQIVTKAAYVVLGVNLDGYKKYWAYGLGKTRAANSGLVC
ncbi:hypothetical protein SCACP_04830 [Sporomusa carbonis]